MKTPKRLSDCTDMSEEQFQQCFKRIDMKMFIENPTQALIDVGITLKNGASFKIVESDEEASTLPDNVFPLMRTQKNNELLSMEELDKVAGGGLNISTADMNKMIETLGDNCPWSFISTDDPDVWKTKTRTS
jgi:hypothetical protein